MTTDKLVREALECVLGHRGPGTQVYECVRCTGKITAALAAISAQPRGVNGLEQAWLVIANAHGGYWGKASDEWREAAERWRDDVLHPALASLSAQPEGVKRVAADVQCDSCKGWFFADPLTPRHEITCPICQYGGGKSWSAEPASPGCGSCDDGQVLEDGWWKPCPACNGDGMMRGGDMVAGKVFPDLPCENCRGSGRTQPDEDHGGFTEPCPACADKPGEGEG